jgi:large subunit ribosomal protein L1
MAKENSKSDKTAKKSQKEATDKPTEEIATTEVKAEKPKSPAKAGKRSTKTIKATEDKIAKEERKKVSKTAPKEEKPKTEQKPPRSRAERAGKKYREAAGQIDNSKTYNLAEAVDLAAKTATSKFDETVEMHINLAVDPKQADQNIREMVVLPQGSGKKTKVAVFVEGDDINKAKKAGADIAGSDEILAALDKEKIEFDILISTPTLMSKLGKYARILGPKGLMPNPKSGTVTSDVSQAVKEAKAGRVEYRVDESGIIHIGIGKASFGPQKLLENAQAIASSVRTAKPASVKGTFVKSTYVSSTMGPSIKTEL